MVRSRMLVLPAPGELIRFTASTSRPANQPRLRSANNWFFARMSCSSETVRVPG